MEDCNWLSAVVSALQRLKMVGLWPKSQRGYEMEFYTLYAVFSIIFFLLLHVAFGIVNFFVIQREMEELVQDLYMGIESILTLLKVGIFVYNVKKVKRLLIALDCETFRPKNTEAILSLSEECNNLISFSVLAQFFTSIITAALALFQLNTIPVTNLQFYVNPVVFCVVVLQIFVYCWFGNQVTFKSGQLTYAAFESNWIEQSPSAKKTLLIFMTRSLRPIQLSTVKLFYLNLETFKKIMQTAWSYYTVLNRLASK